jgi:AraC-like DNA-binding protein
VVEQARREMARHYLLQSSLDLSEIAYLVGYEDANSFFRAFHQWEGAPPGRWRERHQKRRTRGSRLGRVVEHVLTQNPSVTAGH